MKYDLIVTDFDMTLTNTDRVITDRTKKALKEFQSNGGKLVVCSARPLYALLPSFQGVNFDCVISNGGSSAYDIDEKKYISYNSFTREEVKEIVTFLKGKTQHIHLINDKISLCKIFSFIEYFCNKIVKSNFKVIGHKIFTHYPEDGVLTIMIGSMKPQKLTPILKELKDRFKDKYEIGLCDTRLINITKKNVNKGSAIEDILNYYKIPKDKAIAFGDSQNDASMYEAVKTGVAMGNSMQELKDVADVICDTCNNDGLAKYVEEFVL